MLALFAVFEHLSHVRRLLNRFHILHTSPTRSTTNRSDAVVSTDSISLGQEQLPQQQQQQRDILLGPVLNNILTDRRLKQFDSDFQESLQQEEYFARELDACLLEMREIERDLHSLKQRQCSFYEHYLEFIEEKDELVDRFIEYYDEYLLHNPVEPISPNSKQLRRQSTMYEFSVPVSNRFEAFKWQLIWHHCVRSFLHRHKNIFSGWFKLTLLRSELEGYIYISTLFYIFYSQLKLNKNKEAGCRVKHDLSRE